MANKYYKFVKDNNACSGLKWQTFLTEKSNKAII